jgi:hypothetical protein
MKNLQKLADDLEKQLKDLKKKREDLLRSMQEAETAAFSTFLGKLGLKSLQEYEA